MNLEKYQELTGTTVAEGDVARYTATINRINALLATALGYSLDSTKNLYNTERGKVQFESLYPNYSLDLDNLLDADEEEGSYRLFPYNESDIYIRTDPFTNIYHVKLVQPINDEEFVTYTDLEGYSSKRTRKFSRYVQKHFNWFTWGWYPWILSNLGHDNGLLIAVDADWIDGCVPEDLQYLWADMVTYYGNEDYSVSGSLKSESVNGHSWSRTNAGGGKGVDLAPQESAEGLKILTQYAGPNGTFASRVPTV